MGEVSAVQCGLIVTAGGPRSSPVCPAFPLPFPRSGAGGGWEEAACPPLGFLSVARWRVRPGAFPASGGQEAVSLPHASEHIIVPPDARGAAEVVVNDQRQGAGGAGAPSGTGACSWSTEEGAQESVTLITSVVAGRQPAECRTKTCEGGRSSLSSHFSQSPASHLVFRAVVRARPESLGSERKE